MSDNTVLSAAVGSGDTVRDKDRAGVKTQIVGLDLNPGGASEVLCTAGALADATANPTVILVGSCLHGFNGTTWDRLRSTTANGLAVDVSRVQGSVAVTGTFWQATQPVSGTVTANAGTGTFAVSAASLPLPAGAATSAKQAALGTAGSASTDVLSVQGIASMTALKVDGSAVTQPVSAASLPLPSGASTAAKQPAPGTAGTASADVLTVQGIASMTALKVDGSAVTQPVSGTVTANIGTGNLAGITGTVTVSGTVTANAGTGHPTVYTEDAASAGGEAGLVVLGVRRDANTSPVSADGDFHTAIFDSIGNLKVNVVAGGAGDGAILDGVSSSIKGTVLDYANSNPLAVRLSDTNGDYVAAGAGTQYTEDAAAAADPVGSMLMAVRRDTLSTTEVSADGDNIALKASNKGQLHVRLADTVTVDASGTTLTVASHAVTNAGTFAVQAAQTGTWNVGTVTTLTGITNVVHVDDNAGSLTVDNAGTFAVQSAQTGTWTVATNADAAVGAGAAPSKALVAGGVYNTSAPAPTNGQTAALQLDQAGNQRVAPGIATATLSAWNSGTSLNATQTVFTNSGAPAVLVQLTQTTTLTAGAVTAEVTYDGTNWVTISADCVIDPTSTTLATVSLPYTVQASTNKALLLLTKGAQGLRLKLSTQITGTGAVTPNYALLPYAAVAQAVLGAGSATIGSLAANQSVNVAQLAGTTTDTNSGTKSAGTLRVVLATDQPQLTNKLLVTPDANSSVNLNQVGGNSVLTGNGVTGTGSQRVTIASDNTAFAVNATAAGDVANDGVDSGNPVKVGAQARSSEATAVSASGDRVNLVADLVGKLIVRPHCNPENTLSGVNSATGTSDTSVIAAQGAGVRIYVTSISVANSSATNVIVEIKDATTVVWRTAAPANGGSNITFDPPLRLTGNQALNMASLTSATTVYFSACGYKGV